MAFVNDDEFKDDFRKVGTDATASLEPAQAGLDSGVGSSENLDVAGKADDLAEDSDLEDDDDSDEDLEDEDDEDLEDDELDEDEEDLEDDDDEDLEDDDPEDDLDEDDDDDDDLEDDTDSTAVMSRLADAESTARRK